MINEVLQERGNNYGHFTGQSQLSQQLKEVMRHSNNWHSLPTYTKESLEMVQHKIARILNGDPTYKDSWVDIIGYVQLVINELEKRNHSTITISTLSESLEKLKARHTGEFK